MPQVSIIVPVYNSEKYLRDCLDSILNQTFSDYELILVDDGSTDCSGNICDEYSKTDNRICVYHQKNRGQAAARNFAVTVSNAEWLAFVDSDDVIHPQYLERLMKCIDSGAGVCCCLMKEEEKISAFSELEQRIKYSKHTVDEVFMMGEVASGIAGFVVWAKILKKSIIENHPFTEGRVFEDNAVVKKWLYTAREITILEEPLYHYRINYSGTSKGSFDAKKVEDVLWSRDEIIDFYKEKGLHKAYEQAEIDYILFAINLYFKLRKTDEENAERLKKIILERYKKDKTFIDFSKENQLFVFELKYPKLMWLYWKIKAIM